MSYTIYNKQLTPKLKNIILEFVLQNNANPTGVWRDFHCVHRSWRNLKLFVNYNLLSTEDLPEEPNPIFYPDTDSEATLQCPESCCLNCKYIYGCNCVYCSRSAIDDPSDLNLTSQWMGFSDFGWSIFTAQSWSSFES